MDEHTPKVTFENEGLQPAGSGTASSSSGIVRWLIRHSGGYIGNEKQVRIALYAFVGAALFLSVLLLSGAGNGTLTQEEEHYMSVPSGNI